MADAYTLYHWYGAGKSLGPLVNSATVEFKLKWYTWHWEAQFLTSQTALCTWLKLRE